MTPKDAIKVLNMVEAHGSLTIKAKETAIKALQLMDKFLELPMGLPKTGHWIVGDGNREVYAMEYECSECGCNVIGGGDFCKWCGARMFEPQESEDKCEKCEYYINPDYTRCHICKAESEDKQ